MREREMDEEWEMDEEPMMMMIESVGVALQALFSQNNFNRVNERAKIALPKQIWNRINQRRKNRFRKDVSRSKTKSGAHRRRTNPG